MCTAIKNLARIHKETILSSASCHAFKMYPSAKKKYLRVRPTCMRNPGGWCQKFKILLQFTKLKRGHSPRILGLICKIVAVGAPTKGCGCGGSRLRLDPAISTYDGLVPYEVGIKYPSVGAVITRLDSPASSLEASSAGCSKGFSGSGVVGGFKENERLGMFSWYEDSSGTFDRATEPWTGEPGLVAAGIIIMEGDIRLLRWFPCWGETPDPPAPALLLPSIKNMLRPKIVSLEAPSFPNYVLW